MFLPNFYTKPAPVHSLSLSYFSPALPFLLVLPFFLLHVPLAQASSPASPSASPGPRIILAVVVVQHGDRTPALPRRYRGAGGLAGGRLAVDAGGWEADYGQLTQRGMRQARELGALLGERYRPGLLGTRYDHRETHARALDSDRALISAGWLAAGLYPGEAGPVLPVHTIPAAADGLLGGSARGACPRFERAAARVLETGVVHGAILTNRKLLAALPRLSGLPAAAVARLKVAELVGLLSAVRDARVCQRAHRLAQPANVTAFDKDLDDIWRRVTIAKWDVAGLGALVGGRMLRAVARRIRAVTAAVGGNGTAAAGDVRGECDALRRGAEEEEEEEEEGGCVRKLVLYSGHETTIFDVRAALGLPVLRNGAGPYLNHLIFELSAPADRAQPYALALLTGDADRPPRPEKGPFCAGRAACPVDTFLSYVEQSVPEHIDAACGLKQPTRPSGGDLGPLQALRDPLVGLVVALLAATVVVLSFILLSQSRAGYSLIGSRDE